MTRPAKARDRRSGPVEDLRRVLPEAPGRPDLAAHQARHGPLPSGQAAHALLEAVEAAGLTGRGGAGFPLHRKLRAVRLGGKAPLVVANGAEGEPASIKDRTLLRLAPHLVLDGVQVAAAAVGARAGYIYVHEGPACAPVRQALKERQERAPDRCPVELVVAPARFVAGEESAVVSRINGGPALPRSKPPMVFERGVAGRPTLVSNVETLAHLALIARHGPAWFRDAGTADEPGTMLCSVSGSVVAPGVTEVPLGTSLTDILALAGGPTSPVRAVLVGGYHGTWISASGLDALAMSVSSLGPHGGSPGAGVLVVVGGHDCPLAIVAKITDYLARQSARQCGPCLNGLPALSAAVRAAAGRGWTPALRDRIDALTGLAAGRGACHHPDGTVRLIRSALVTFADDLAAHAVGQCVASTEGRRRR